MEFPEYVRLRKSVAACATEAFKLATNAASYINNYIMYNGTEGVYSYTFEYERRQDCPVCGSEMAQMKCKEEWNLEDLIEALSTHPL